MAHAVFVALSSQLLEQTRVETEIEGGASAQNERSRIPMKHHREELAKIDGDLFGLSINGDIGEVCLKETCV